MTFVGIVGFVAAVKMNTVGRVYSSLLLLDVEGAQIYAFFQINTQICLMIA